MFRLLLRPVLLLSLLAALPIFAIRAQPYDDSELRAFLTPPEGCPAPCFMGIRPGVTTAEEAISILDRHEWVANYEIRRNPVDPQIITEIQWEWSDKAPKWLDDSYHGGLFWDDKGRIDLIYVVSHILLGEFLLLPGFADYQQVFLSSDSDRPFIMHRAAVQILGLETTTGLPCRIQNTIDGLFSQSISLYWGDVLQISEHNQYEKALSSEIRKECQKAMKLFG